jgi:hypothetical protein
VYAPPGGSGSKIVSISPRRDGAFRGAIARKQGCAASPGPGAQARKSARLEGVSFAQLEYFVAVAEEAHVGRAALKLRVAQPAVSRQIRLLEDELQVSLFQRTPKGMRLSPAGTRFRAHAQRILQGVREAKDAMLETAAD